MTASTPRRLVGALNVGSSSVRVAFFDAERGFARAASGEIERLGRPGCVLRWRASANGERETRPIDCDDASAWVRAVGAMVENANEGGSLLALGHRIVHGGDRHVAPERVTSALLDDLRALVPFDAEHLTTEIALIEALSARFPALPQIACFDTAFHAGLPRVARLLPLPRAFQSDGLRRYGFHGLAYAHVLEELARRDPPLARGKLVLAHLGNGCSLAAVEGGESRDTTMGFSPVSGIMMGTRSGDLDPGLVRYLAREHHLDADAFHELTHERCGLLGVSETSSDVRDLLAREADDPRAAEALELFCHGVRKSIGAFAAVLGGIDGLCFSGGIGENAPVMRARICERLEHLGIALDPRANAANEERISVEGRVRVHRVVADEALQIARATARAVGEPLARLRG